MTRMPMAIQKSQKIWRSGGRNFCLLPALTAVLLILSYPKFNQGWLAWFALAPLTVSIWKAKDLKAALSAGFAAGFLFYFGILYWIYPTMRAGGVNAMVSLAGWAALGLLLSVEFVLISILGFCIKKTGPKAWPCVFACGWVLLEYGKVLLSLKAVWFPWFMLGYTQWQYNSVVQMVSLTGVYGLSAAVCFSGALLGTVFLSGGALREKLLRLAPAVLLFALIFGYGRYELKKAGSVVPGGYINAVLLQPSIDLYAKWDGKYDAFIKGRLEKLLEGAKGAELVVWPENALPAWIDEPGCSAWLKKAAAGTGAFNIVGSVSQGDGKHVAAFLLDEKGEIAASYYKRRLVPFGEYVPMRAFLGRHIKPVAALGEFLAGSLKQTLFDVKGMKFAPVICYESIFPYLFTGDAGAGARAFVNITNDGWYLDTAAPRQHFLANIFRAVETRRPLLRAANNGISALIDPWGRVTAQTKLNEYRALSVKVPLYPAAGPAFYGAHGRWFIYCAALIAAAFLLAVIFI